MRVRDECTTSNIHTHTHTHTVPFLGHAYSAGRFGFLLRFRESAPVGAKHVLCLTVQVRIEVAGSDCDSVACNENDSEDLRFTQYGTHDENQDDGEVTSQERSLVQDNPR